MNCRVCGTPAARHEMADHGEDGKGTCFACVVKQRDEAVQVLRDEREALNAVGWRSLAVDDLLRSEWVEKSQTKSLS